MTDELSFETGIHIDGMKVIDFYFFFQPTHEDNLIGFRIEQSMWNPHSLQIDFSDNLSIEIVIDDNTSLRATSLSFLLFNE